MSFSVNTIAADMLSVADLEKITGLTGVHATPKDQAKGAGGDLNFANADNKLIAMVMIQDAGMFDFWKKQYGKLTDPVPNLGLEAFQTKPGSAIAYVFFHKGNKGVWIQSMGWNKKGAANITDAQLLELARLAASRM
jgi:hypothetical protein